MSGEAYELPETRMELREPALDPIEEGRGSLGGGANSDDNIFVHIATEGGPGPGLTGGLDDKNNLSTTSRYITYLTHLWVYLTDETLYGKKLRIESIPGQKSSLWVGGKKIVGLIKSRLNRQLSEKRNNIIAKKHVNIFVKILAYPLGYFGG
jgi:hypothetical protein